MMQTARERWYNSRLRHGVFFAVLVPVELRPKIATCFAEFQTQYPFRDRMISPQRLHLSLNPVFAGECLPDRVVRFSQRVGASIRFEQFEICLDKALTYRNRQSQKPFVLASSTCSKSVNGLVDHIAEALASLSGTKAKVCRPISPHVTLIWDEVSVPECLIDPITLPVREVSLVHSHIGQSRYDILGNWPLVG